MVEPIELTKRKRLGNADNVATICGYAKRTVLRYADSGKMPWGYKIGSLRRWDLDEVEAWIAGGCKPVRTPSSKGGRNHG
jgi:predicted DNA-binding transcriptional regulator AlpA